MSMEYLLPQRKAYGNPYPDRNRIRRDIYASFAKTVASLATTEGGGKEKPPLIKGMSMEYLPPQRKAYGNPCPQRNQIRRDIYASIAKAVVSLATTKGEGKEKEKEGGQGSSASTAPQRSGYSYEGNFDS